MDSLKNCPFCGHMAVSVPVYSQKRNNCSLISETAKVGYIVKCVKCRASMQGKRLNEVVKSWNRRANENSDNKRRSN